MHVLPSPSIGSRLPGASVLPRPAPDDITALSLTPLEFLERIALLIHPPRIHRHRYHGALAPNAKLRDQVIALGLKQSAAEASPSGRLYTLSAAGSSGGATPRRRTSSRWAALIARIYEVFPLLPSSGLIPLLSPPRKRSNSERQGHQRHGRGGHRAQDHGEPETAGRWECGQPEDPEPDTNQERGCEDRPHDLGPGLGPTLQVSKSIITKVPDSHHQMDHRVDSHGQGDIRRW